MFEADCRAYGARKVWRRLNREGPAVARCTVERLMRGMGLAGRVRGRHARTTVPAAAAARPADLALDTLEMAVWSRRSAGLSGLVHHSDRGAQYLSIRYSERLGAEGAVAGVGSKGDSCDNAMAESVIGLYKAELVHARVPWRTVDEVELATLVRVHRWNTQRLHSAIAHVPPVELEDRWHARSGPGHARGAEGLEPATT